MTGGQKDNAITREAVCDILVSKEEMDAVKAYASKVEKGLREEYDGSDKGISIQITEAGHESAKVLHPTSREKVLFYLMEVPFGIQKMSANIEGLVETSTNIGIVSLSEDEFFASSGVRSSVEAARNALSDKIQYLTEFLGGEYEIQGAYPAWEYRKESPLRDKMVEVYETMYGQKPEVVAIHAGLECGLFYKKIDGLDCVSLGPDMKDIHTSEEVLDIASTERVWKYLVKVLEELKIDDIAKGKIKFEKKSKEVLKNRKNKMIEKNIHSEVTKIYINAGKKKKIRVIDIVGAFSNLPGINNEDIGVVEVQDLCSYVDILNYKGEELVKKYKEISIKKKIVKLRKDRQS